MIPSIHKQGSSTYGLLNYLYGKGTKEEHVDPHLVASFDGTAPDPGRDQAATLAMLRDLLDQPLHLIDADQRPTQHVWHCSVRAAPTDRILTDDDWADIARRIVAATGIDPGDGAGCRWAAVRHADDHIHIIATLVREDGRKPDHHRSGQRAQTEARLIEADYDLHRVAPGDGTAAKRATRAERHKAERLGQQAPSRDLLREHVRQALAGAADEQEFFDRLATAGVLIDKRLAPSGDTLGYKVALPGDVNGEQEPIWYPGSKLAPDLSLPRIRKRLKATTVMPEPPLMLDQGDRSASARARRFATEATDSALAAIAAGDDPVVAAQLVGVGEVLDALAQTSSGPTRDELRTAASDFERATRSHIRARDAEMYALRRAARQITHSGTSRGQGPDLTATALVLDVLILAVIAAARWHAARGHAQQAEAAARAARHLRTAYQATATEPLVMMRAYGKQLPIRTRQRHSTTLQSVLPHLADRIQAEPGWPALAAVLDQAEHAGHDTSALLQKAAASRELDSADAISDVLVWRLYHLGETTIPAAKRRHPAQAAGIPVPVQEAPRPRRR
ncbi:relaxase/mobilization nuclease domain-containing protein [Streptomyces violascens]|uniref:Mobilization protein n=1 Tax=Streptomyces violascens TaxID=67381 RepID=A0ABQ3R256_9ACTN|nr:relaxase/mobilization nuclease domain-containing protein [Streptomyces violascens]GGU32246.1 mobilization protein [Streptomyces violascens]GHI43610.1 mobilization protein [Streptomyces violascens]